ncbi:MAG: hypothetical protein ABJG68_09755 [Crocinitomicaceae bacterium]
MDNIIIYNKFKATLRSDGILYYQYSSDTTLDLTDFENSVDAYIHFSKGKTLKVLAEFPEFSSITVEAREYLQKRELPAIAEAIVFKGLSQKILFNFYKLFRTQNYPIKGFQSKENALNWLSKY